MASKYPKLVLALSHSHDGWIVGTGADPSVDNPRDYDIIIPYSEWQKASSLIPLDAKPNHFGGWKCMSEGVEVDVWPGDIGWIMQRPGCLYVFQIATGIRWKKEDLLTQYK